jgi:hypothetical protein
MTASAKFILLSILVMSILIPARAAGEKNPRAGLKKALRHMTVFNLIYVLAVVFIYPRLL